MSDMIDLGSPKWLKERIAKRNSVRSKFFTEALSPALEAILDKRRWFVS
jgi:hypothetical protein